MNFRIANLLAGATLVVVAFLSLLNLKSADFYTGGRLHEAQTVWFLVGFVVLFVASRIELVYFERFAVPLLVATAVVLLLTLAVGKEVNHARRWIEIFGVTLQASEVAKLSILLATAAHLAHLRGNEPPRFRNLGRPLLYLGVIGSLILVQPDLGTTLIVVVLFFSVVVYDGMRIRSLAKLALVLAIALPAMWHGGIVREYQKDRVRLWLHTDPGDLQKVDKRLFDKYMQPKQALWAVGSGGATGRGLHAGNDSRLRHLYAIHTDFVLATFAEEHGFIGVLLLLLLYFYLIAWTWIVSAHARDRFGALVCFGTGALMAWQCWTNLGMLIGLAPVVGITFPLMSYGGSSVLVTLFALGLVHNVARVVARPV